jgi:hypothetical protein
MTYRNPVYLGNGAYAQIDEWGDLVLSTGSHIPYVPRSQGHNDVQHIICLEGTCVALLLDYIDKHAPNGSQNYTIKRIGT